MTEALQRDLLTRRWRRVVEAPRKEVAFHIQLVSMLRWCIRPDVIWRHVPNGEHRDARTAAKLKAMGVLPGSADLEFHWCEVNALGVKIRRMLHLELKTNNRQRSDKQVAFALAVRLLGDDYEVARSIDQALEILDQRALLRRDVVIGGRRG